MPIDLMLDDAQVTELPLRRFAVCRHDGTEDDVDETRRPLYQHLILNELVGGPPVLRFDDAETSIEVLVGTTEGFHGDELVTVERMPASWHAVALYEGPASELPAARAALRQWCDDNGHERIGPVLQVHLMDEIEGATEQELQVAVKA